MKHLLRWSLLGSNEAAEYDHITLSQTSSCSQLIGGLSHQSHGGLQGLPQVGTWTSLTQNGQAVPPV